MNNMRRGFTMIELVFVIVIIGILAAVALPRFTGIAEDARVSKLEAFVGTLNRTTAPSIWSNLLRKVPAANGSITDSNTTAAATPAQYNVISDRQSTTNLATAQVETIPAELGTHDISLAGCTTTPPTTDAQIIALTTIAAATVGTATYEIVCVDGSLADSPHFYLHDGTTVITR